MFEEDNQTTKANMLLSLEDSKIMKLNIGNIDPDRQQWFYDLVAWYNKFFD